MSHETPQQAACILKALDQKNDWGFNQLCFLGYPARQYLIPIIPSLIFGKSQIALNLGFSIYLIIGITIFSRGIFTLYKKNKKVDIINAILLIIPLHFYHFNHHLFHQPEQSIFPISFAFIFTGIFLQYLHKKSDYLLLILGIGLQYLIFSYTTSLAFYFLGITALSYILAKEKNKRNKIKYILIIILSAISLFISINQRKDINIFGQHNQSINIIKEINNSFEHIIFQNHGFAIFSPIINFIIIITLLLSLSGYLGLTYLFLAVWIILTIIISTISQGYAFYGIDARLQRILIAIPIILLMINKFIQKQKIKKHVLIVIYLALFLTGIKYHYLFMNSKKPNKKLESTLWLQNSSLISKYINGEKETILLMGKAQNDFLGVNDYLEYFKPELILKNNNDIIDKCNLTNSLYLIPKNHPCLQLKKVLGSSTTIENYTTNNNEYLLIYHE